MADEPQTKDDIKNLMKHLEDEYRKANISEKTYKEMKEKYKSQLLYIQNTISSAEPSPEQQQQQQEASKEGKPGLFGKLFHKEKEEKTEQAPATEAEAPPSTEATATDAAKPQAEAQPQAEEEKIEAPNSVTSGLSMDIEKIKVMLDSVRDQKKSTDDSLQSIFESVGELRSMIIQNDATVREITSKMEHIDDEISQVKPKDIDKKFREMGETLEKYQASLEKIQKKTDDMSESINKTYEILKSIGNIENLSKLNEDIQHKLEDIKEAMRYVERLSSKDEKIFIDLKRDLEDMVVYKAKQDALDDSIKDMLKSLDGLNVKFEGYSTKKDLDQNRDDIIFLKKELETIKKSMGLIQSTLPEPIVELRKQRDDIKIFLDSVEEQMKGGKIKISDYENMKKKNIEKLKTIENSIQSEWKIIEAMPKTDVKSEVKTETKEEKPAEEKSVDAKIVIVEEKNVESKSASTNPADTTTAEKPVEVKPDMVAEEAKPSEEEKHDENISSVKQESSEATKQQKEKKKQKKIETNMPF
jgi:chromosome segregation ATPase